MMQSIWYAWLIPDHSHTPVHYGRMNIEGFYNDRISLRCFFTFHLNWLRNKKTNYWMWWLIRDWYHFSLCFNCPIWMWHKPVLTALENETNRRTCISIRFYWFVFLLSRQYSNRNIRSWILLKFQTMDFRQSNSLFYGKLIGNEIQKVEIVR